MNQYVTGAMVKKLREERKMTQADLAEKLCISDKTVSKWETGKGYPDITLIEPLADALGISVIELMSGDNVMNANRSFNMRKMKIYVCPICGNVICSTGDTVISCCGIVLPPLEAEKVDIEYKDVEHKDVEHKDTKHEDTEHKDTEHIAKAELVEDEYFVTVNHEMSKSHYISFMIAIRDTGYDLVKLYPEGNAQARFKKNCLRKMLVYCNRDGLFDVTECIPKAKRKAGN